MTTDAFGNLVLERKTKDSLGRRDHLTFRGNTTHGRHGWLRLTPAYSLHVVEEILGSSSRDSFVLDPFSGTGTTSLVAAALGMEANSVDINPFLVWLGNLKLTQFKNDAPSSLRSAATAIIKRLRRKKNANRAWVPPIHQIDKWWDDNTLTALSCVADDIATRATEYPKQIADALSIVFCRVMIQTAHVSFAHQSMSFKRRKKTIDLPLFESTPPTEQEIVFESFLHEADGVATGILDDQPKAKARVFLGDSRNLATVLPRKNYSLVLTSPPYPNRMSYIRELRPYMYWLRYLETGREAGELDWQAIGGTWGCATSNLGSWTPTASKSIPYPSFDRIVKHIGDGHRLLGPYVHKYFEDIKTHLKSLCTVLASRARCYYIVGNSKFYDTLLPVQDIYAALFKDACFINVRTEIVRKRTSKKELFEYVVYAEKP